MEITERRIGLKKEHRWNWYRSVGLILLAVAFMVGCGIQTESETAVETLQTEPDLPETEISEPDISEPESKWTKFIYELPIDMYEILTVNEINRQGNDYVIRAQIERYLWESEVKLTWEESERLMGGHLMRVFYRGEQVFTVEKRRNEELYDLTNDNGTKKVRLWNFSYLYYAGKYEDNTQIRIDFEKEWIVSGDTEVLVVLPDDSADGRGLTTLTMEQWYTMYQVAPLPEWSRISILEEDGDVIRVCPAFSYEQKMEIRDMDDQYLEDDEEIIRMSDGELEKLEDGSYRLYGETTNCRPIILTTEEKSWLDAGCSLFGKYKGVFCFSLNREIDYYSGNPTSWEGENYVFWQEKQSNRYPAILTTLHNQQKEHYDLDSEQTYYLIDDHASYDVYRVVDQPQAEFIFFPDMKISVMMYYYFGDGYGTEFGEADRIWTMERYWTDWYEDNAYTGPIFIKLKGGKPVDVLEGYAP